MQNEESPPMFTHDKNMVSFWEETPISGLASAKAGRPICDSVLMMRVASPGQKSDTIHEIERIYPDDFPHPIHGKKHVNDFIYKQFARYVDEYKKNGSAVATNGTPIEQWALVDRRTAQNFKHNGIHNVEALASLSDSAQSGIPGARAWVQKAKDWLAQASNSAAAMQAQEHARKADDRLNMMQDQLNSILEAMNELPPEAKAQVQASLKRRGQKNAA